MKKQIPYRIDNLDYYNKKLKGKYELDVVNYPNNEVVAVSRGEHFSTVIGLRGNRREKNDRMKLIKTWYHRLLKNMAKESPN